MLILKIFHKIFRTLYFVLNCNKMSNPELKVVFGNVKFDNWRTKRRTVALKLKLETEQIWVIDDIIDSKHYENIPLSSSKANV